MIKKWFLVICVIVINIKFWCNERLAYLNYPTYDHYILPLIGWWSKNPTKVIISTFLGMGILVATLTLGSQPRQGFAKVRAKRRARECGRVWEWTFTLPNELSFWELESRWSPEISENDCKGQNPSPWRVFYIIGKNYWNVNVQNGFTWPIWTSATQVMAKRKAGSQTSNLTPDHGKSGINPIPLHVGGVQHVVGKLLTRATTLV
jgi:hypothetical protein